jgi:hypothetical protein
MVQLSRSKENMWRSKSRIRCARSLAPSRHVTWREVSLPKRDFKIRTEYFASVPVSRYFFINRYTYIWWQIFTWYIAVDWLVVRDTMKYVQESTKQEVCLFWGLWKWQWRLTNDYEFQRRKTSLIATWLQQSLIKILCSRPDLEDVMWFISNILGSGKSILFLIVSISVNDVSRKSRRLWAQEC